MDLFYFIICKYCNNDDHDSFFSILIAFMSRSVRHCYFVLKNESVFSFQFQSFPFLFLPRSNQSLYTSGQTLSWLEETLSLLTQRKRKKVQNVSNFWFNFNFNSNFNSNYLRNIFHGKKIFSRNCTWLWYNGS